MLSKKHFMIRLAISKITLTTLGKMDFLEWSQEHENHYWAAGLSQERMARAWKNSNRQTNFACNRQVVVVYFE